MEAREAVEASSSRSDLQPLLQDARQQREQLQAKLSDAFRSSRLAEAAQLVTQLIYVTKLEEEIVARMPAGD